MKLITTPCSADFKVTRAACVLHLRLYALHGDNFQLLGEIVKLLKTVIFVIYVRMEHLGSHGTGFFLNWYLRIS